MYKVKEFLMRLFGIFSRMRTHRGGTVDYTDIAYIGSGASGSGTTSCSVPYPASVLEGYGLILTVGTKLQTPIVSTPTGWRRIKETIAYSGSNGSDQGAIRQTTFWKEADGTETGSLSVTVTAGNSAHGHIYAFSKDPNAEWNIDVYQAHHNTPNTTSYSAESYEQPASVVGDLYFIVSAINTDTYTWSAQAISQTGATFTTVTQEINELATTQGNDQDHLSSLFLVASGTGSGPLTFTATSSGASAAPANPLGVTNFIRLRQSATAQTWAPSGLQVRRASELTSVGNPNITDGSAALDGGRISVEGSDAGSVRYSIVTKDARDCLKVYCDITTGLNRRSEWSNPVTWQPAWVPGTQWIEEIRWETDTYHNNPRTAAILAGANPNDNSNPLGEWIIGQTHTGAASTGGPYPSNHPLYYFGWAYPGQTGYANLGGGAGAATGGEFIVVNKVAGTRYIYGSVTWQANTTYRIRHHVKFDYITVGDPCLKVWVNDVLLHEKYDEGTISVADADLGSASQVGGVSKKGIYHHMVTDTATRNANIAAGHKGIVLYTPSWKFIVQHPTDIDYITDITNNSNPIYDYVDTSDE
jgi:hypothetical protein